MSASSVSGEAVTTFCVMTSATLRECDLMYSGDELLLGTEEREPPRQAAQVSASGRRMRSPSLDDADEAPSGPTTGTPLIRFLSSTSATSCTVDVDRTEMTLETMTSAAFIACPPFQIIDATLSLQLRRLTPRSVPCVGSRPAAGRSGFLRSCCAIVAVENASGRTGRQEETMKFDHCGSGRGDGGLGDRRRHIGPCSKHRRCGQGPRVRAADLLGVPQHRARPATFAERPGPELRDRRQDAGPDRDRAHRGAAHVTPHHAEHHHS